MSEKLWVVIETIKGAVHGAKFTCSYRGQIHHRDFKLILDSPDTKRFIKLNHVDRIDGDEWVDDEVDGEHLYQSLPGPLYLRISNIVSMVPIDFDEDLDRFNGDESARDQEGEEQHAQTSELPPTASGVQRDWPPEHFATCETCQTPIHSEEAHVTLLRNVEQLDAEGALRIAESVPPANLCEACGHVFLQALSGFRSTGNADRTKGYDLDVYIGSIDGSTQGLCHSSGMAATGAATSRPVSGQCFRPVFPANLSGYCASAWTTARTSTSGPTGAAGWPE